ncbi:hypothetical protein ACJIZ3_024939 [Penstemon smallii]|uniref:Uncharacterized protein n=1 Tax=Penstemon smallii TaxID=265156 RepID=A0ABD3TWK4_9LAMI
MAATRLLKMSKPLGLGFSQEVISNSSMVYSRPRTVLCVSKAGLSSENPPGGGERKPVAVKAAGCALTSEPKTDNKVVDLALLLPYVSDVVSPWLKFLTKQRPWGLHIQMFIEKVIIDCRFFTLLATAGSLIGSVLCFVEGCFLILESYFQYFHAISQLSEQGHHVMLLLIEAIDMFLVGTALLVFGMALHVMFVGSKGKGSNHPDSSLSRKFDFQKLQSWMGMESVMQAKSKIGHAVIMILQVEVLEKCKSIPMSNGLDLACFAGVVFLSSASIFILSKIAVARAETS